MSRPNTWPPGKRPPEVTCTPLFPSSQTPERCQRSAQRSCDHYGATARWSAVAPLNVSLPEGGTTYIYHSHYLVSIQIVSAINKVVHRNTHFAHLLTSESCTRTVTVPFSTDTLPVLRTSPARSEPHSSFTYPVAVRSPIVTYKIINF
jgi:hypothetical protein